MASSKKRTGILLLVAIVLGGLFLLDRYYGLPQSVQSVADMDVLSPVLTAPSDTLAALHKKKLDLENFKSNQQAIDTEYFSLASVYTDRIASLSGLVVDPGIEDRIFIENMLRAKFDTFGTAEGIKINVAESEPMSKGVRKAIADVSFNNHSSQDTLKLVLDLGDNKSGMVWRSLTLTTDRNRKDLMVNGRLAVFLAEVAE